MIPAPLNRATQDRDLSDRQARLLTALHAHLDYLDFRPVKLLWAAHLAGGKDRSNVSKDLRSLVRRGYLVRGPDLCERRGLCYGTYRLSNPLPPVVDTTTPKPV